MARYLQSVCLLLKGAATGIAGYAGVTWSVLDRTYPAADMLVLAFVPFCLSLVIQTIEYTPTYLGHKMKLCHENGDGLT